MDSFSELEYRFVEKVRLRRWESPHPTIGAIYSESCRSALPRFPKLIDGNNKAKGVKHNMIKKMATCRRPQHPNQYPWFQIRIHSRGNACRCFSMDKMHLCRQGLSWEIHREGQTWFRMGKIVQISSNISNPQERATYSRTLGDFCGKTEVCRTSGFHPTRFQKMPFWLDCACRLYQVMAVNGWILLLFLNFFWQYGCPWCSCRLSFRW